MPWNSDYIAKNRTIRLRIDPDTETKLTEIMKSRRQTLSEAIRTLIDDEHKRISDKKETAED